MPNIKFDFINLFGITVPAVGLFIAIVTALRAWAIPVQVDGSVEAAMWIGGCVVGSQFLYAIGAWADDLFKTRGYFPEAIKMEELGRTSSGARGAADEVHERIAADAHGGESVSINARVAVSVQSDPQSFKSDLDAAMNDLKSFAASCSAPTGMSGNFVNKVLGFGGSRSSERLFWLMHMAVVCRGGVERLDRFHAMSIMFRSLALASLVGVPCTIVLFVGSLRGAWGSNDHEILDNILYLFVSAGAAVLLYFGPYWMFRRWFIEETVYAFFLLPDRQRSGAGSES